MTPGELLVEPGEIELNAGRETVTLQVANTGDRPIQVGSHYHFFEVNEALSFERELARGMRLNIPAGTAVRFEPGDQREVTLVALAGNRQVYGFNAKINGTLDAEVAEPKESKGKKKGDGKKKKKMSASMYRLYDYLPSGNGYKVRLLLTQLGIPFEYIELDILQGETRTPEFLEKNPNGRIPVLELEPSVFLSESNAILLYLGEGTSFLPTERLERARVTQWLFFEQYSHEPYIATSRFWLHQGKAEEYREALIQKQAPGYAALGVMEKWLKDHPFLVGDRYTIADIALFAYTHVAEEGGFSLEKFPGIQAWIERVQAQPQHIPITSSGRH